MKTTNKNKYLNSKTMADIIKKKDEDLVFVFKCPICGTIFTEKQRAIGRNISPYGDLLGCVVDCPNCKRESNYSDVEEYDKNKDYE